MSGMSPLSIIFPALQKFGLPSKLKPACAFGCDVSAACKTMSESLSLKPKMWFENVTTRNLDSMCHVDLFMYSAPCQSFSTLGKNHQQGGHLAADHLLSAYSLLYVRKHMPKVFICENVKNFATQHKKTFEWLLEEHRKDGYSVSWQIVNTGADYGFPQRRSRLYMIGIHKHFLRARTRGVSLFPPVFDDLKLKLDSPKLGLPLREADWKPVPDKEAQQVCVLEAYRKCAALGLNPFSRANPVIVDCGSSKKFSDHGVHVACTLTASRCAQTHGYWSSWKGGFLSTSELCTLMGYCKDLCTEVTAPKGVTQCQLRHMLGNGQSGNFLLTLIPRLLYHSCAITYDEFQIVDNNLRDCFERLVLE